MAVINVQDPRLGDARQRALRSKLQQMLQQSQQESGQIGRFAKLGQQVNRFRYARPHAPGPYGGAAGGAAPVGHPAAFHAPGGLSFVGGGHGFAPVPHPMGPPGGFGHILPTSLPTATPPGPPPGVGGGAPAANAAAPTAPTASPGGVFGGMGGVIGAAASDASAINGMQNPSDIWSIIANTPTSFLPGSGPQWIPSPGNPFTNPLGL